MYMMYMMINCANNVYLCIYVFMCSTGLHFKALLCSLKSLFKYRSLIANNPFRAKQLAVRARATYIYLQEAVGPKRH